MAFYIFVNFSCSLHQALVETTEDVTSRLEYSTEEFDIDSEERSVTYGPTELLREIAAGVYARVGS